MCKYRIRDETISNPCNTTSYLLYIYIQQIIILQSTRVYSSLKNKNTKGLVMERDKVPHVVILPLPLSGHIKPMLTLAELLCDAGFLITFVNSDYNHDRLERVMDIPAFYNHSPGFRFVSISDGLPLDQPRLGPIIFQLFFNTRTVSKPLFRELLISLRQSTERSPPTCIIADGLMCFAIDVAEELGVPIITFPTHGSHGMWTIMHTSNLIEEGEVPFQGKWTLVFLIPPICNIYNNRTVFSDGAVR